MTKTDDVMMLCAVPATMSARLSAYVERKSITADAAVVALLDAGLRAHERAVAAGQLGGTERGRRAAAAVAKRAKRKGAR